MVAESQEKFEAQPYSSLQKWLEGIVERAACGRRHVCIDSFIGNVANGTHMVIRLVPKRIL